MRDWLKFPELRLDRYAAVIALLFALGLYVAGRVAASLFAGVETNGRQLLVWCFFISTAVLYHVTYSVNSFAHLVGTRRFPTEDGSRNNLVVALSCTGRRLAQQPSSLSRFGPSGILLVGSGLDVLCAPRHGPNGADLGSQARAGTCAERGTAKSRDLHF